MTARNPFSNRSPGLSRASLLVAGCLAVAACSPAGEESDASGRAAPSTVATSPTAEAPAPHDIVSGDDVAILERLIAPTTGETWQTPVEIENLGLFAYPASEPTDNYRYFHIGNRGDARIIAVIDPYFEPILGGHSTFAVVELEADSVRMITCPSTRAGDGCLDFSTDWLTPARSIDSAIHYDSLTYPSYVEPVDGWVLRVAPLKYSDWPQASQAFGDANDYPGLGLSAEHRAQVGRDGERTVLASLGDSALVEWRRPAGVTPLIESHFVIETPYGGVIPSWKSFSAEWYGVGAVTWDDGTDTFTHPATWTSDTFAHPVTSANLACALADESLASTFDESHWVKAGTHRQGVDVYLPLAEGNPIARDVYRAMSNGSWGAEIDPALAYPYETVDEFLDARSVFAWQRPDGEWIIALDSYATQRVYECV